MANTDITLINDGGVYVPSAFSIPVVRGNTVSFATSDGTPVVLCFSPDAASVLSPTNNPYSIGAAGTAVFTFSSSNPGAYSVFFVASPSSAPKSYPTQTSQVLVLEVVSSDAPPFTGPTNTVKPGS